MLYLQILDSFDEDNTYIYSVPVTLGDWSAYSINLKLDIITMPHRMIVVLKCVVTGVESFKSQLFNFYVLNKN